MATADDRDPAEEAPSVEETMNSLCEAFAGLLSEESSQAVQQCGLEQLAEPPSPEAVYSTEIRFPAGTVLPMLVAFDKAIKTTFEPRVEALPSAPPQPAAVAGEHGPLGMLLGLELPLSVRFGRTQLPIERVLELQVGSILELEGSHDDPVDLLVNGSVVARGEVVAVDGNYGVRILEITRRDEQLPAPNADKEAR